MVNIEEIIERVKALKGFRSTKEVAELLKLSAQDFSNRKKRDTLLPLIVDWAVHENVSLDWLLTGEGVNFPAAKGMTVAEIPPAWGHPDPEIQAVVEIMESMDKDTKQDIRLSVEKEKLLRQLLRQREDREAG